MESKTITDLEDSAFDFMRIVYPKLKELKFVEGEVITTEAVTADYMKTQLDMQAGIDAWLIKNGIGIIGIASRIQWFKPICHNEFPFNSFTIRRSRSSGATTEYKKRMKAINSNGLLIYPYYTCQAYLTERRTGNLVSIAIARTVDLCKMITSGYFYDQPNPKDGNIFGVVRWEDLQEHGYEIKVWVKEES